MSAMSSLHHSHEWRLSISLVSFVSTFRFRRYFDQQCCSAFICLLVPSLHSSHCLEFNLQKPGPVVADLYVKLMGLGFLSMSIPPVLSKATGTCSVYEAECVDKQIAEFFCLLT